VPIYYMNVQIIGRSAGRTATGAAAYRAGERIIDERTGHVFDYTRRRGEIETQILAPEGAPAWAQDRAQLWNRAEAAERRGDAQVAREMVVAFPKELNAGQQWELMRAYVREEFVSKGMVADVAIHRNPGNPHAHIMLTMREMGSEGFSTKKNREWNKPELLLRWREQWAVEANRALEKAGREERIDHRSLAEQGVEHLPQVHLGPHAAALERRGIPTEKGEHNRSVAEHNAVIVDLEKAREERRQLQVRKAVADRYNLRTRAGWLPVHAQALAQLEYSQAGRELTQADTARMADGYRREQRGISQQIRAIQLEGDRLQRATTTLERRQQAAAHLERLQSRTAWMKRWFSGDARKEFAQAEERLARLEEDTQELGTTSEAELEAQRSRWQRDQAQLPELHEKAASLGRVIELAATALAGFARAHDREYDWLTRPKRVHDRDPGRDRDSGRDR
jgi:ATP-dependent exoDNAse (exonuclease V) alpha subunit